MRWWERGSESLPATTECGESFTAMCLILSPNDILAQSADATEMEASGENLTTKGRRSSILSRLLSNCSSGSFPPLEPTKDKSKPSIEASCSTSRYFLEVASTSWPSLRRPSMTGRKKRVCFGVMRSSQYLMAKTCSPRTSEKDNRGYDNQKSIISRV